MFTKSIIVYISSISLPFLINNPFIYEATLDQAHNHFLLQSASLDSKKPSSFCVAVVILLPFYKNVYQFHLFVFHDMYAEIDDNPWINLVTWDLDFSLPIPKIFKLQHLYFVNTTFIILYFVTSM